MSNALTVRDLAKVVHLLGEIAVLGDDYLSKKKFLISGLCQLVRADSWVWALGRWSDDQSAPEYSGFLHSGFSYDEFGYLIATVEHPDNEVLCADWVAEVSRGKGVVTAMKDELDTTGLVDRSELKALLDQAGIKDAIISGVATSGWAMSSFGFYRRGEKGKFTQRDKAMVDLVLSGVSWLHRTGWEKVEDLETVKLYPQYKRVLNLLLAGLGKKEIANQMGLAESTVATYMREVYKYYDVSSQALLMRKLSIKNSSEV